MSAEQLGRGVPFQRIRRITGYLVGTMEKWNDAKKAEERDRVKHGIGPVKTRVINFPEMPTSDADISHTMTDGRSI